MRSRTFDRYGRFDSVAFFSKGVTRAILKDGGTVPLLIDILTQKPTLV